MTHATVAADTGSDRADVRDQRSVGWVLLIGGTIGLVAAFTLMVEKLHVLTDPTYVPSCTMDAVLSCTDVMMSDQAGVFGFPNPLLGIGAFPVLMVLGALLVARVRLPDWVWLGLQIGVVLGLVFVGWLISQTLWQIEAVCPYCMVVWAVVIPIFWTVTAEVFSNGAMAEGTSAASRALVRWKWLFTALTWAVVLTLVLVRFWDHWMSLL